jgi:putative two-component system response regulator
MATDMDENRRVLIVDDNESIHVDFHKIIGENLGRDADLNTAAASLFGEPTKPAPLRAPFLIDSAHQGQEAVARVQQSIDERRRYAVAFVDIRMPPGWNGIETVQRLWQIDEDLQIVICTAYSDYSWSEMVTALRASDRWLILKKPFDNIEVLQLASTLVAKWNLAQAAKRTLHDLQALVREQTRAVSRAHEETIYRLVRASLCRDEETGAHIRRVGLYSEQLAAAAGWDAERVDQIRLAAPMHDVGKIGIPDAILRKPGKLARDEVAILQTHSKIGANMLAGSSSPVLQMAAEIAMHHHERWDGAGYPDGLAGCEIPESARLVAIVDVYDALSHNRVYRKALPEASVVKTMIDARGKHFDPRLLDLFLSLLPEMRTIAQAVPDEADDGNRHWSAATNLTVGARTDLQQARYQVGDIESQRSL